MMDNAGGKRALLFPGQGAQAVGMGKDLAAAYPVAARVFAKADSLLDFPLSGVCFDGPADELNRTDVSQPAILAHSWAVTETLRQTEAGAALLNGATAVAGLSLGEYSALAAAGAIAWDDALVLVRKRGQYMQEACDAVPSTMASILGLDREPLEKVCAEASALGVCVLANFNSPGQIAIAGSKPAVAKACELAKAAGAKRCIELSVAGAFHSPLMEPARERLAAEIARVQFRDPAMPVVANVTAKPVTTADEARRLLVAQLTAPVMWADSMQYLVDQGYADFIELGPGEVLAGLLKRVAKDGRKLSIGTAASVAAATGG
jgi:[acyl-carrier-protein] S-malonyltransferase